MISRGISRDAKAVPWRVTYLGETLGLDPAQVFRTKTYEHYFATNISRHHRLHFHFSNILAREYITLQIVRNGRFADLGTFLEIEPA